jgi:hypothetical protein
MVKFLTVFNIVASAASIVGLYVTLTDANRGSIIALVFLLSLPLSFYVLLVPNSTIERNVRSKIMTFENPELNQESDEIIIQRGEFTVSGHASVGVEFYTPFRVPPEVVVINSRGYSPPLPSVDKVTTEHASFKSGSSAPFAKQTFVWVARGIPLKRK